MSTTIKATYNEPSKECLWLVEVIGANRAKFCGERGNILKSKEQDYFSAEHAASRVKYLIASVDEVGEKDANFKFKRIVKLDVSAKDISYQFSFGWDNEIGAETLEELKKKIEERLKGCREHIVKAKKSEDAITRLLNGFNAHLKNFATQSAKAESLIADKREQAPQIGNNL